MFADLCFDRSTIVIRYTEERGGGERCEGGWRKKESERDTERERGRMKREEDNKKRKK